MKALVDADIIAYRCACSCEEEDTPNLALLRVNDLMGRIIQSVNADSFLGFLSSSSNFRKEIDPEYKANRKDKTKPKWLDACRTHLVTNWDCIITYGIEADDALGISQTKDTIIASLDKDLLQIAGLHYNFVKNEFATISEREGLKRFWTQMVVGDTADNIFGIRGIGPKKAEKLFEYIEGEDLESLDKAYYDCVAALYNDPIRMHRNAKLLWIMHSPSDIWLSPEERKAKDEETCSMD